MTTKTKEGLKQTVLLTMSVLVVLMGALAFVHTPTAQRIPFIRELATWLGYPCPSEGVSAMTLEHVRSEALPVVQGSTNAPLRPAFGFALDNTDIQQAFAWLQTRGLICERVERGFSYLKCKEVPEGTLGINSRSVIDEMDLSFNSRGKLIAINLLRRKLTADQVVGLFSGISQRLTQLLGEPTRTSGEISVKSFSQKLNTVSIEYSFKDYLAKVTASYLPWSGVVLYEQYMSYTD